MAEGTINERFDELVQELVGEPGVTPPGDGRGFGADTLRIGAKTFAMVVADGLVLKLPKQRVHDLVDQGLGERLVMRQRTMKEWVVLGEAADEDWSVLAREAMAFVASGR